MKSEHISVADRNITIIIFGFWGVLIVFGLISLTEPQWLRDIANPGKLSEALDIKHTADDLLRQGQYHHAINAYKRVLKVQPDMIPAAGNLAITYYKTGQYAEALKVFRYILSQKHGNLATAYFNMAEVYEKLEDVGNALQNYSLCAEVSPLPSYSLAKSGLYYYKSGQLEEALVAFEQSLETGADLLKIYKGNLLEQYYALTDTSEFRQALGDYLDQDADQIELGRFDATVFEWKLHTDRDRARTHYFMGLIQAQRAQYEDAISHYEQALLIWPRFTDAHKNYEALKSTLGSS